MINQVVRSNELDVDIVVGLLAVLMMKNNIQEFTFTEADSSLVVMDPDIEVSYLEETDEVKVSLINE